jgi:imidazolonepropionase-like amidohydrolase
MAKLGVPILAGTDTGNPFTFPGFSLHDELGLLVQAGLSPAQALRAATYDPALFLNATDSLGTIAPSKLADLVLLDGNPLQDISNTRRIAAVLANGRLFRRPDLDELLAKAGEAASHAGQGP